MFAVVIGVECCLVMNSGRSVVLIIRNGGRFDHILLGPNAKLVLLCKPDQEEHTWLVFDDVCALVTINVLAREGVRPDIQVSGGGILGQIRLE